MIYSSPTIFLGTPVRTQFLLTPAGMVDGDLRKLRDGQGVADSVPRRTNGETTLRGTEHRSCYGS